MEPSPNSARHKFIQVNAPSAAALMAFTGMTDDALQGSQTERSSDVTLNQKHTDVIMPLVVLAQSPTYQEHWSDGTAVELKLIDDSQGLILVESEHHMMVKFQWSDRPLEGLVTEVYTQAYELAHQQGFKHLIRVWNYLDQINQHEQGIERYQTFCVARHHVLETMQQLDQPNPAATAIGGHYGHNTFVFLFSRQKGDVVENKRQVSAWQYPTRYAPKQPRFSRAMQCGKLLMCSGTASVVGHETIHLNDLGAQLDECLINVQALLDESSLNVPLETGVFRFYLRNKALLNQVISLVEQHEIGSYIILEGDVCRENLLIECEAVFQ